MLRSTALILAAPTLIAALAPSNPDLTKYKKIEAYEVRPGILMMPVYNAQGELCEIGLQPLSYSPDVIRLGYGLSKEAAFQIFEELVPTEARGPQPTNLIERNAVLISGRTADEYQQFENVSIHLFYSFSNLTNEKHPRRTKQSKTAQSSQMEYESASIQFKKHPCK